MSLSNAEIAERLDGMKRRGVSVERGIGNTMAVCKVFPHKDGVFQVIKLPFLYSSDLLAFCRAVVERVDGAKDDSSKPQHNVPWTFSASS